MSDDVVPVPDWYTRSFADEPKGFWWLTGDVAIADVGFLFQALTAGLASLAERAGLDDDRIAPLLSGPVGKAFEAARSLGAAADMDAADALSIIADAFDEALAREERR